MAIHRFVVLVGLAACSLDFGDDSSCPGVERSPRMANPATLACELHSEAAGCYWDPNVLSWGDCDSGCRTLDESTCIRSSGCRAAYDHDCFFGGACSRPTPFLGCYPTDLNLDGVTGCAGLDAWSCSRHEQCLGTYRAGPTCSDRIDQDGDGAIDEPDECLFAYVRCVAEPAQPL